MTKKSVLLFLFVLNLKMESLVSFRIPHYIISSDDGPKEAEEFDPLRMNLTQCAHQNKAGIMEVENFIKRVPQKNVAGKCFTACMLKKSNIIRNKRVSPRDVIDAYSMLHADSSPFMLKLRSSLRECVRDSDSIPDVCEHASIFSECMNIKVGPLVDVANKKALGHWDSSEFTMEEENLLSYVRKHI